MQLAIFKNMIIFFTSFYFMDKLNKSSSYFIFNCIKYIFVSLILSLTMYFFKARFPYMSYLSSAIDDHSRFILASEFYDNQEERIVEDTFRKAILKYGRFDKCYFDNGSQYVAKQLKLSLALRKQRPKRYVHLMN